MTHTIENEFLQVSVNDHGAELCSIFDKEKNREVIWQADPAFWKRHAPVLFPNVGRHYLDHFRTLGREFPSKQHGFARDSEFICACRTEDSITHVLKSSPETLEKYPYEFQLEITHTLKGRTVTVSWKVTNPGEETMYFTIGGHPAFNVPADGQGRQSEYLLSFEGKDSLTYYLVDLNHGTARPDEPHTLSLTDGCCRIDEHMFDKDALVVDGQIEKASILFPDGTPYVSLSCKGFPNFGIWSVPGAPFVCLEPWMGRCDDCGFEGTLAEKENINSLKSKEEFHKEYFILVGEDSHF